MTEIINKITSYNLFNYLLPGVLFAVFADYLTSYHFVMDNLIIGAFVYYFIGLVISRFGSIVIEPSLRMVSFIKFSEYKKYVKASQIDPQLAILSQENNTFRTYISMLTALILLKIIELIEIQYPILKNWNPYVLVIILLILFLYSYKKQTSYITKRINANTE